MKPTPSILIRLFALPAMFLCFAAPALADVGLDDYRNRVREAKNAVGTLWNVGEDEDKEAYQERVNATIDQLQTVLPAHEAVIYEGRRIEIDNEWVRTGLASLTEVEVDSDDFSERLTSLEDRISALDQRLNGAGKVSAVGHRDENKARMASILRRPEFNKNAQDGGAWERLKQRILKWLRSLFPNSAPIEEGTASAARRITQWFVYGVLLLAGLYAIWRLIKIARSRRSWWPERVAKKERVILGERLSPEKTAADLFAEAEGLAVSGDLRAAIRKAYIAFLVELADRKEIKLRQDRTNWDYLRAVREKRPLYEDMKALTNSFERHWYGLIPADQSDWTAFRDKYSDALRPL